MASPPGDVVCRIASVPPRNDTVKRDVFFASNGIIEAADLPQWFGGRAGRAKRIQKDSRSSFFDQSDSALRDRVCRLPRCRDARIVPEKEDETWLDIAHQDGRRITGCFVGDNK